jgi:hypothetical protein
VTIFCKAGSKEVARASRSTRPVRALDTTACEQAGCRWRSEPDSRARAAKLPGRSPPIHGRRSA